MPNFLKTLLHFLRQRCMYHGNGKSLRNGCWHGVFITMVTSCWNGDTFFVDHDAPFRLRMFAVTSASEANLWSIVNRNDPKSNVDDLSPKWQFNRQWHTMNYDPISRNSEISRLHWPWLQKLAGPVQLDGVKSRCMTSRHMTWRHVSWHDVTSHDRTSHDMTSRHMTSHDMMSRDMTSRHMTWRYMTWRHVTWHDVTWHDVTSHDMTSRHMTWRHVTWHWRHVTWHDVTPDHVVTKIDVTCAHEVANTDLIDLVTSSLL
jgi:hypothetical protein